MDVQIVPKKRYQDPTWMHCNYIQLAMSCNAEGFTYTEYEVIAEIHDKDIVSADQYHSLAREVEQQAHAAGYANQEP